MVRNLLLFVLVVLLIRLLSRVLASATRNALGRSSPSNRGSRSNVPARGVQMVRDPVCGTYVIPGRAILVADGGRQLFFCSENCREKYQSRPSTRSGPSGPGEERTA